MSNQVTPFEGKALATGALQTRLQRFKQTRPRSSDGSIYLKMAKDGEWSYGAEEEVPEDDSTWAANPASISQGYICWPTNEDARGGGPLDEVMYDAGAEIPLKGELPHREGGSWGDQLSIGMKCMSGEDEGLEVVYKVNSKSGVRELNSLIDEILAQIEAGAAPIPVFHLRNDHYKHKKYGKIYTPVFKIVDWLDAGGNSAGVEDLEDEEVEVIEDGDVGDVVEAEVVEVEPEEKPKRTRRKADPVEKAAEAPAEDAPKRRRRRTG